MSAMEPIPAAELVAAREEFRRIAYGMESLAFALAVVTVGATLAFRARVGVVGLVLAGMAAFVSVMARVRIRRR